MRPRSLPAAPARIDPFEGGPTTERSGQPASDVRDLAARPQGDLPRLEAEVRELDASGDRRGAAFARERLAGALLEAAEVDARARALLEDAAMLFEDASDHASASRVLAALAEAEERIDPSPSSFSAIYLPRPTSR